MDIAKMGFGHSERPAVDYSILMWNEVESWLPQPGWWRFTHYYSDGYISKWLVSV